MEKTLLMPLIMLFTLIFQNTTAQTHTCMVYDDLTYAERVSLGISEQEFLNTGQYALGVYRVVLVCDNNVIESHNLIIQ